MLRQFPPYGDWSVDPSSIDFPCALMGGDIVTWAKTNKIKTSLKAATAAANTSYNAFVACKFCQCFFRTAVRCWCCIKINDRTVNSVLIFLTFVEKVCQKNEVSCMLEIPPCIFGEMLLLAPNVVRWFCLIIVYGPFHHDKHYETLASIFNKAHNILTAKTR